MFAILLLQFSNAVIITVIYPNLAFFIQERLHSVH